MAETTMAALTGLRVLDLTRVLAGPSATQMLGDLGADVVKVERPGRGDDTRGYGPPFVAARGGAPEVSAYFIAANRNKRSIAIDLADARGRALLRRLARQADVLVENFRAGDLDQKGLGHAALCAENPRLIYCSITGFGHTGPLSAAPGYDLVAQAMSGFMQLTGPKDGPPCKAGLGIADLICGYHAVIAVLAALAQRERTGRGQHIDLALYDAQLAALSTVAVDAFATGREPERQGNGHPHIVPYGVFETADGHLALTLGNDAQFTRFANLLGESAWLDDARFTTNAARVRHRTVVDAEVTRALRANSTATWYALLSRAELPCGPVRGVLSAFDAEQALARNMSVDIAAPQLAARQVRVVGNPLRLSASPIRYRLPPPELGAHTEQVLHDWLGTSARESSVHL